ncbi:MAG TPA: protein kinase [Sorangium sp.]|nr:protein kinase [Sorangium sp.]
MVAVGDIWEGHELLNEELGMVRHFLARQVGDARDLVWLHIREGSRLDEGVFAEEIARLQRLAVEVPEVVTVLYGGVSGSVAWAASPVLGDAVPLIDATRGSDLGPTDLQVLIDVGRCLLRAHELSFIHGALGPDRVVVVGDGRYAITHFGFVRLFQLGAEEARRDPYGHAPPELLTGGWLDSRADVYGFGTITYELMCKRALSPWLPPPSFPSGIPPLLQLMMRRALEENPERRQPSIGDMLSVLTPFARAWEELGGPPELPHANIFAEPAGARHTPDEQAPRPPETPDTLKSAVPPRDARDHAPHAPPVAPWSPPVPDLPDLEPMVPVAPAPSTPPRSPMLPAATPAPSALPTPRPSDPGRRSPARWLGAGLALALVLGSAVAVLWREQPRRAAPRLEPLGPVVQAAAVRATPPSARPLERCPEPLPGAAPPPVAARPRTKRPAAPTWQTLKTPAQEPDPCDGLLPCQKVFY